MFNMKARAWKWRDSGPLAAPLWRRSVRSCRRKSEHRRAAKRPSEPKLRDELWQVVVSKATKRVAGDRASKGVGAGVVYDSVRPMYNKANDPNVSLFQAINGAAGQSVEVATKSDGKDDSEMTAEWCEVRGGRLRIYERQASSARCCEFRSFLPTTANDMPQNQYGFTLASAHAESDLLNDLVSEALVRQVNRHVANFTVSVQAMSDMDEGLQSLLSTVVSHIVSRRKLPV